MESALISKLNINRMAPSDSPLTGKRILVPPARPESNPLLWMLKRKGADVLEFPGLRVAPPIDYSPMDRAIHKFQSFDWVIFSGSNCVVNFIARLNALGVGKEVIMGKRVGAIGHGAYSALSKAGIEVAYAPGMHTAETVTEGFERVNRMHFLLVRVDGASRSLPERLRHLGAEVTEVAGYRMLIEADVEMAEKVFGGKIDVLALANPTAARFLAKATDDLGIDLLARLKEVTVAAVGPTTAEAATVLGLTPDIVSKGHIADLAESLAIFLAGGAA